MSKIDESQENIDESQENPDKISLSILKAVADPRVLRVIIFPTEQCNFRCTYCYEDFKIGRMSLPLVSALKKWLLSRVEDLDQIVLSWFGGEPTLALPIVVDVSNTVQNAFIKKDKKFSSGMTTNGYLLSTENFMSLLDAGITDYQISLDGHAEIHNRSRVLANGGPTFSILWNNLTNIAALSRKIKTPFRIGLRIHYDHTSARQLRPLVDQIKSELRPSKKFTVQFHEIEKLGGPGDAQLNSATEDDHNIVRALTEELRKESEQNYASVALDYEGYVCYAAKANSFILRADGRLGKCTVALNDPRNDVGKLNMDGTITVFNDRHAPWLRGLYSGDAETLACPLGGMDGWIPPEIRRYKE